MLIYYSQVNATRQCFPALFSHTFNPKPIPCLINHFDADFPICLYEKVRNLCSQTQFCVKKQHFPFLCAHLIQN